MGKSLAHLAWARHAMCGIAGVISRESLSPEVLTHVANMSTRLAHRGPDGHGSFHDGPVAMAIRRLSIIDVQGGQQPLFNEDRSLVLIANGEIYNHVELREQLRRQGHQFKTGSDCEVIGHLYEQYGLDCVKHLRGMFAFALWDSRLRRLMLARDRMGEKPLYLYVGPSEVYFASELKGLLASGSIPFEFEPTAVDLFFHYGYVPEPLTPLRGIRKLQAANILTIDAVTWEQKQWCYWRMEDASPLIADPVESIKAELDAVCSLIVRSDVPVGIALSGGLDSGAIAAMTAKQYPGVMQAFTVGYREKSQFDERKAAKALANSLKMPICEVELAADDVAEFFPGLMSALDDPIADISAFGYYSVMKAAKAHGVSVMLQGHGGDELFWGYPWVREAVAQTNRKLMGRSAASVKFKDYLTLMGPAYWSLWGLKEWGKAGAGLCPSWEAYLRDRFSPKEQVVFYDLTPDFRLAYNNVGKMYGNTFLDRLKGSKAYELFTIPLPWPEIDVLMTRLICQTYLQENGIAQGDRLSMASSVELRLPLVDYRLVETVVGLRKASSDYELPPKAWLRAAMKNAVPEWVLNRPKRGFTPPVREWHKAIFAIQGAALDEGFLVHAGVLKPSSAKELAKGPFPPGVSAPLSFKALTLELWGRQLASLTQQAQLSSLSICKKSPSTARPSHTSAA